MFKKARGSFPNFCDPKQKFKKADFTLLISSRNKQRKKSWGAARKALGDAFLKMSNASGMRS